METNVSKSVDTGTYEPVPPELLAWAKQTFDAQEFLTDFHEVEATGGSSFETIVAEVEAQVRGA